MALACPLPDGADATIWRVSSNERSRTAGVIGSQDFVGRQAGLMAVCLPEATADRRPAHAGGQYVCWRSLKPSLEGKVGGGDAQALDKDRGQRSVEARTERRIDGGEVFEGYHVDHAHLGRRVGDHPRAGRCSINEGHLSEELAGTEYGQDRFGLAAPALDAHCAIVYDKDRPLTDAFLNNDVTGLQHLYGSCREQGILLRRLQKSKKSLDHRFEPTLRQYTVAHQRRDGDHKGEAPRGERVWIAIDAGSRQRF